MRIVWTAYLQYRARLRNFQLDHIEEVLRYSNERYYDTRSGRFVAIGRCGKRLCAIPYEISDEVIVPITVHATSRPQILQRLRTGRYVHVQG